MNEKINFSGGEPIINFNDLNRDDTANRAALFGIMKAFNIGTNENFIISGCVATINTGVDVDVTAGYIFLNEEILQVDAQTVVDGGTVDLYKYAKATTFDSGGDKTFNDAVVRQTWAKHRGVVTATTSPILTTELDVVDGDRLIDKIAQDLVTGTWTTLSLINSYTGTVKIREDKFGYIEILTDNLGIGTKTNDAFAVLPSEFRTNYQFSQAYYDILNLTIDAIHYGVTAPYELKTTQDNNTSTNFYLRIPKVKP